MKFTAEMKVKGQDKTFQYSLTAKDIFEADKRFQDLADKSGWVYVTIL